MSSSRVFVATSSFWLLLLGHISLLVRGGLDNCAIAVAAGLDPLAVDAWGTRCCKAALSCLLSAIVVNPFEVEGVEMPREVAGKRRLNVSRQSSIMTRTLCLLAQLENIP